METKQDQKPAKSKVTQISTVPVRVKRETKRRLLTELAKVNKKAFGRKVLLDALIARAMDCLKDIDILALQESSLSNADRLEMSFRDYAKAHGPLSKDEFVGKLLAGEIIHGASVLVKKTQEIPA